MDRIINTKTDKQTIYEIYRACRLCGGGAGYKMPIVQNVIDLDNNGVDLKQKIQECLQIEVHQDDKMPPLICELCVDKVNDFYDFMEMCKQTNKRTRLRLGLPAQTFARSAVSNASSDSGDCILGVTEPVYVPDDDDNEPLSKSMKVKKKDTSSKKNEKSGKDKVKKEKEPEVKVKVEKEDKKVREPSPEVRKTRHGPKRDPTPPKSRSTRHFICSSVGSVDDNTKLSILKGPSRSSSSSTKSSPQTPRSILKKELKELGIPVEEDSPRTKRVREKEPAPEKKTEVPSKKVKIAVQPATHSHPKPKPKSKRAPSPPPKPKRAPSPPPKPKRAPSPPPKPKRATSPPPKPKRAPSPIPKPKRAPSPPPKSKRAPSPPPPAYPCPVCNASHKTVQGCSSHLKSHAVTFTNPKLACDPCSEWFSNSEEYSAHHRKHKTKPYYCRHCYDSFKTIADYDKHFEKDNCKPFIELPDVKCDECWRTYPTQNLLDQHRCQGPDGRPGGKCMKCNRMYTLLKNLKKHESTCTYRKKGEAIIDPKVEKQLKNTQIRLTRCDELLTKIKGERYDISDVDNDFGFDSSCIYPYRYRIKSEPTTGYDTMVTIGDEIKQEYYAKNYVHWDSDDSDSDGEKVHSLTSLTLKTIFSSKFLGKVPKKRRRIKSEKFDNTDFDMSRDIDSIIDNLGKDDDYKDSANDSDCSESIFGPFNNKNDLISDNFDNLLGNNFDSVNSSEKVGNNEDSQDSQSLISNIQNDLDLNNGSQNDVNNDNVINDKIDESSKVVTDDEADGDSSIVDNVQNLELSKTEINDTMSQENERLESNEQIRLTNESASVENSVNDNLNGVTECNNLEINMEESNVKINGQTNNHSLENVNDMDKNDLINDTNKSIENNDRLSHENNSSDSNNDTNNKICKVNDKTEVVQENNGNLDDLGTEKDRITLDDIVTKGDNLKGMDLDSISDEEFNFDA